MGWSQVLWQAAQGNIGQLFRFKLMKSATIGAPA